MFKSNQPTTTNINSRLSYLSSFLSREFHFFFSNFSNQTSWYCCCYSTSKPTRRPTRSWSTLTSLHCFLLVKMDFDQTRLVGDYVLGRRIGSGSFAVVWRSWHRQSGRRVAVKEIDKKLLSPKVSENLLKEISILSTIDHPNIIRLFESIEVTHLSTWLCTCIVFL